MSDIVTLSGYILIPDNELAAVCKALDKHIRLSRAEAGCLSFEVRPDDGNSSADPTRSNHHRFTVQERFVDRAAFEHHQSRIKNSEWAKISQNVLRFYPDT